MCTQADHQLISVPSLVPPSSYCPSAADNTPKDKGAASFKDAEYDTEDSEDRDMSEIDYRDEDDEERRKKESISGLRKEESTARLRKEDDDAGSIRMVRERRNAPGE
jgi:hypothetical protein